MKKRTMKMILAIAASLVSLLLIVVSVLFVYNASKPIRFEFKLSELEDGIYCYKTDVVSSIPAQNYTLITVSDKDGNTYTIHGSLSTRNYDGEPYIVWDHKEMINSDSVIIYAPIETIKYLGVSTVR